MLSVGFTKFAEGWPSCYWHAALQLYLVVYVDDFKLSGPRQNIEAGWDLIKKGIRLEPPTDPGLYLGCHHIINEVSFGPSARKAMTICYDMEKFLE